MALPNIKFNVNTDGLNRAGDPVQKIPGLVITGATVAGKVTIGQSYQIFTLKQAEELGITADGDNAFAHKHLSEFYAEAGNTAELWVMLVSDATTYEVMTELGQGIADKLIADANGSIRVLGVIKKHSAIDDGNIEGGLDSDCHVAVENLQTLSDYYFDKYRPFRAIISGNAYTGTPADLTDYGTEMYPNVMLFMANLDGSKEASVGALLGRFARISTQRHPGVPIDGAITTGLAYLTDGQEITAHEDSLEAIHGKKYTFLRSFTGRAGYFVSDDLSLSRAANNDYSSIARGLVIDEAVLIAYDSLVDKLNEDIEISEAGGIHPAVVKSWQNDMEQQIILGMRDAGKIQGVKAFIDTAQDILSTDRLVATLSIQPKGYAKYIDVNIGLTVSLNN